MTTILMDFWFVAVGLAWLVMLIAFVSLAVALAAAAVKALAHAAHNVCSVHGGVASPDSQLLRHMGIRR